MRMDAGPHRSGMRVPAALLSLLLAAVGCVAGVGRVSATEPPAPVADTFEEISSEAGRDPWGAGEQPESSGTSTQRVQTATATTTWSVAVVTYVRTDAWCNGVRVVKGLTDWDRGRARAAAGFFAEQISAYSDGMGSLAVTYIERPALTSVSDAGNFCWPAPVDVDRSGGFPTGFDSVHVQYPGEGLNPYFGLGMVCGGCTGFGPATYGTSRVPNEAEGTASWWDGTVTDGDVFTHEWMHDANAYMRNRGFDVPDPHEDASGRYWWSGGWSDALLSGDVLDTRSGQYVGWTSTVWSAGSPTNPLAPRAAPPPNDRVVGRAAGADRYGTAAAVSRELIPSPGIGIGTVFVATGEQFPDALAGGPAAASHDAPLLLVRASAIPAATRDELLRLRPARIVVLGGPGAVSDAVLVALRQYTRSRDSASVIRVGGSDRYDTAARISSYAFASASAVLIATGANYPDALVGSAAGARHGLPLLLVTGTAIPITTERELNRLRPERIYVLGGPSVVSDGVAGSLPIYASSGSVTRLAGPDRYVTAVEVSRHFFPDNAAGRAFVATGRNFPDALAASAAGAPLQLVPGTSLPGIVRHELRRLNPTRIVIAGGPSVVSDSVAAALAEP